jgi:hypothetical protein
MLPEIWLGHEKISRLVDADHPLEVATGVGVVLAGQIFPTSLHGVLGERLAGLEAEFLPSEEKRALEVEVDGRRRWPPRDSWALSVDGSVVLEDRVPATSAASARHATATSATHSGCPHEIGERSQDGLRFDPAPVEEVVDDAAEAGSGGILLVLLLEHQTVRTTERWLPGSITDALSPSFLVAATGRAGRSRRSPALTFRHRVANRAAGRSCRGHR